MMVSQFKLQFNHKDKNVLNNSQKNILKINYAFIVLNIFFWLFVAIYFSFFKFAQRPDYLLIKILLFFESLFFVLLLIGIANSIKIIYWGGLCFVFVNVLLSVTDQMGLFDLISLLLISLFNSGCP